MYPGFSFIPYTLTTVKQVVQWLFSCVPSLSWSWAAPCCYKRGLWATWKIHVLGTRRFPSPCSCSSLAPGPKDPLSAAASQTPAASSELIKDANENCLALVWPLHPSHTLILLSCKIGNKKLFNFKYHFLEKKHVNVDAWWIKVN